MCLFSPGRKRTRLPDTASAIAVQAVAGKWTDSVLKPKMSPEPQSSLPVSPEMFAVDVFSELDAETIARRWHSVNVILRMSVLGGLDLHLDAALNLLCDLAGEIVRFQRGAVYFWEEDQETMHVRVTRNIDDPDPETMTRANVLNFWCAKTGRPLLMRRGIHAEVDSLLSGLGGESALVIPLFVRNRVVGSMQLFGGAKDFSAEDAQLLWTLSLVAENLLTRDYANEALLHYAFTDYLTSLKTRGYFEQQLELELKRAERRHSPVSLLMIDIDHFKQLNDKYGHQAGDQVLRDVASLLVKDMREIDTVARYGGEEFVIVLPETTHQGAMLVANRLRRSVETAPFFAGSPDQRTTVTISIGVAVYSRDARFKRDLLEASDTALYEAKTRGRNRVVSYSEIARRKEVS